VEITIPPRHRGAKSIASAREDKKDRQNTFYFGTIKVDVSNKIYSVTLHKLYISVLLIITLLRLCSMYRICIEYRFPAKLN